MCAWSSGEAFLTLGYVAQLWPTKAVSAVLNFHLVTARAQGTTFTYQGRLNDATGPANGNYNLTFTLFDTNATGSSVAGPVTNSTVAVTNGLFTTTVDFGAAAFTGGDRWLEIAVQAAGGTNFTTLVPRQPITATPYAITAGNLSGALAAAGLSGEYSNSITLDNPTNLITGTLSGDGSGIYNVNALSLGGLSANSFWMTGGNSDTSPDYNNFIGTSDNAPLELRVHNARGFRIEPVTLSGSGGGGEGGTIGGGSPGIPNLIGGGSGNFVADGVQGAVIAGGGGLAPSPTSTSSTVPNSIAADYGAIGGGEANIIRTGAAYSAIGGGQGNSVIASTANIGGGSLNVIQTNAGLSVISGGTQNQIQTNSYEAVIGGGAGNVIASVTDGVYGYGAAWATIGGGLQNRIWAFSPAATISGGYGNIIQTNGGYAFIGGGQSGLIDSGAGNSFIGGGYQNKVLAGAYQSFIGAGRYNTIQTNAFDTFIGGGDGHTIGVASTESVIAGGGGNTIKHDSAGATISGGNGNIIDESDNAAVIAGGQANEIHPSADHSVIGGGADNTIQTNSDSSTIAGGSFNVIWHDAGQSVISGGYSNSIAAFAAYPDTIVGSGGCVISGGNLNTIQLNSYNSIIAGGLQNEILTGSEYSTISGGFQNTISRSQKSLIAGGNLNTITNYSYEAVVGGGYRNLIQYGEVSAISGGFANSITNDSYGVISGGINNTIDYSSESVIGGGADNIISNSENATIPGGYENIASGDYAFAAGNNASAIHFGSFVWSDSSVDQNGSFLEFSSTHDNQFSVRATGGVRFVTDIDGNGNPTAGVKLNPSGTSWATISDRNAKKNFVALDYQAVLTKLATVPISKWNYKWEKDSEVANLGPMAQDFKAAFYPGRDDKSITTLEFDGVELAAIQGLNQKLEAQQAENAELKAQLAELKKLVQALVEKK